MLGLVRQVGVAGGGEYRVMAKVFLHLDQINAGFDQVRGIGMAQAVGAELFFRPQARHTRCRVFCTPPRSSGVVAAAAPFRPPWRLGNNSTGLRCTCQKRRSS